MGPDWKSNISEGIFLGLYAGIVVAFLMWVWDSEKRRKDDDDDFGA